MDKDTRNISLLYESVDPVSIGREVWNVLEGDCLAYSDPLFSQLRNWLFDDPNDGKEIEKLIKQYEEDELSNTHIIGGTKQRLPVPITGGNLGINRLIECGFKAMIYIKTSSGSSAKAAFDNIDTYKDICSSLWKECNKHWKNWQPFYKHFYMNVMRMVMYYTMMNGGSTDQVEDFLTTQSNSGVAGNLSSTAYRDFTQKYGNQPPEDIKNDTWWSAYREAQKDEISDWEF